MSRSPDQLRRDALQIWQAGVDAVRSEQLVASALRVDGSLLIAGDQHIPLGSIGRIGVVGAGKAGAGMAAAVEQALGPQLLNEKEVTGWVNVPAGCERPLQRIHLHAARPAGVNEPTPAGVEGVRQILRIVEALGHGDLCLCLLSGGGSALLPAPVDPITLEDKLAVTRHLSAAGANIEQLNIVRKQLSSIKGGGLLRACQAERLVALVISDVLGDPLESIASGPTVPDTSTAQDALRVLQQFDARAAGISSRVFDYLNDRTQLGEGEAPAEPAVRQEPPPPFPRIALGHLDQKQASAPFASTCQVSNCIIGNNATAVEAAGQQAQRLGYAPRIFSAQRCEGAANDVGVDLAEHAVKMRQADGPDCLISGGEPVVKLVEASQRGRGGRNQQLVLAALKQLDATRASGIVILSGGTDGEDGPTDAAGAMLDDSIRTTARELGLIPSDFLARNDAYNFFQPLNALITTGPTHTNVCDLRVALVDRM